ncbi:MAG: hypothetical protein JW797_04065 [Bradymonadales bacterium]|nr:hypothetical protein [Bradymonadales bacterium]
MDNDKDNGDQKPQPGVLDSQAGDQTGKEGGEQAGGGEQEADIDREGEPSPAEHGATIIDFETFRQRLEQQAAPLGLDVKLGKHIREGVRQYLLEHVLDKEQQPSEVDLTFDGEFLKTHGRGMLGSVLLSLANSLFPSSIDFEVGGSRGVLATGRPSTGEVDSAPALDATAKQPVEISPESDEQEATSLEERGADTGQDGLEMAEERTTPSEEEVRMDSGSAAAGGGEQAKGDAPDIKVNIDVDLLQILRNLLRPRKG